MQRTLEFLTVLMSGVIMASVLRYHGFDQMWPSASGARPPWTRGMMYNNAIVLVGVWAPMGACLALLASTRFRSSASHVTCWWWLVIGRLCFLVCETWIHANQRRATALNISILLEYVFVGCWYSIGGWLPALAYWLLSVSSTSETAAHVMSLLSSSQVLLELQSIGTATALYFGAMAMFHALENWRHAYRVWLGVGSFLCAFTIALSAHQDKLGCTARFVMDPADFKLLMSTINRETLTVAAGAFCASIAGRLIDKIGHRPDAAAR